MRGRPVPGKTGGAAAKDGRFAASDVSDPGSRMLVPLIAACCLSCAPPSGDGEAGGTDYFLGTLSVFGTEMRLLVEVPADGPGVLVSPDQSPEPVPLSSAAVSPETLEWAVEAIGASFAGAAVDGEPGVYDGVFTQGALPLKLTMRRVTKAEAGAARTPPRPQTPVPPFAVPRRRT